MSTLTTAGENYLAAKNAAQQVPVVTSFVYANISGLDTSVVPPKSELMPVAESIVDEQPVTSVGRVNDNQVVHSNILPNTLGGYDYNWVGLKTDDGTLLSVLYTPLQKKHKRDETQIGDNQNWNFITEYNGLAELAQIDIAAESWQLDTTTRLEKMDSYSTSSLLDLFGNEAFIEDGFQVYQSGANHKVRAGVAYVKGLRVELGAELPLIAGSLPGVVFIDSYYEYVGLERVIKFDVRNESDLPGEYTDALGNEHKIVHIADIDIYGLVNDVRKIIGANSASEIPYKIYQTLDEAVQDKYLRVKQPVKVIVNGTNYVVVETGTGVADGTGFFVDLDNGKQLAVIRKNVARNIAELRAFNPEYDGQEIMLLGHTKAGKGGGAWFFDMGDTESPDNNGTCLMNPFGKRLKRKINGVPDLFMFGCLGDGSDDSVGFQNAATAGDFYIPKCDVHFLVGDIVVPAGRIITGESSYIYTAFNAEDVEGLGAVVYDVNKDTFISWGMNCEISQCTFHGVDRSRPFQEGNDGGLKLFKVAVFRCEVGFGRTNHYTMGNCRLLMCHFSGNTRGIAGLVDSHVVVGEVNANETCGVRISAGCNDTVYMDIKNEWNNTSAYEVYGGQSSVQISGGIADRSGESAFSVTNNAGLRVTNVTMRRSGRLSQSNEEQDCHIALRGGSAKKVKFIDCDTATGGDDGGGGYVSPARAIVASNTNSIVGLVSGCDLTGVTTEIFKQRNGGSLTINSFVANDVDGVAYGSSVTMLNAEGNNGMPDIQTIADYGSMIYRGGTDNITQATDVLLSDLTSVDLYNRYAYDINIIARDPADDTFTITQDLKLIVQRGSGNASLQLESRYDSHSLLVVSANIEVINEAGDKDGSIITLTVTPSRELQVESLTVRVAY